MIAAVTAAGDPHPLAGGRGECPHRRRRDSLLPGAFECGGRSLRVGAHLVTNRFEAGDAFFEFRVVQVCDAALDGVIEALEPQIGLGSAFVQFADMLAAALGSLLPVIEHRCQYFFETVRLKQPVFDMAGNQVVQLLHRD